MIHTPLSLIGITGSLLVLLLSQTASCTSLFISFRFAFHFPGLNEGSKRILNSDPNVFDIIDYLVVALFLCFPTWICPKFNFSLIFTARFFSVWRYSNYTLFCHLSSEFRPIPRILYCFQLFQFHMIPKSPNFAL